MPCRSDYLEPSNYEVEIKKTVKNLLYLIHALGEVNTSEMANAYSKTYFDKKEGDKWVEMLCTKVRSLSDKQLEDVVFNAHSKESRQLADWWEEHEKADNLRINEEAEERERREKDWETLYNENNLSNITSSPTMTRGVVQWFIDNGYEAPVKSK